MDAEVQLKKHGRQSQRTLVGGDTSSKNSSNSGGDTMDQSRSLKFKYPAIEAEFLRVLHPKPLVVVPIALFCATILFLQHVFSGLRGANIEFALLSCSFVFSVIVHVCFWRFAKSERQRDLLLAAERALVVVVTVVVISHDVYFSMQFFRDCRTISVLQVSKLTKVYRDANCERVYLTSTVNSLAAVFAATQFIRFPFMVIICVYATAVYAFMWVLLGPPNMLFNVWLFTIFVGASLAFIAFVRYDQEQVQRQQFVQSRQLVVEHERLAEQEQLLADFCTKLLPRSLLRRVGSFEATRTTDESSSATALVVGIHDFGVWCTRNQPPTVAKVVVQLQSAVRSIATQHRLDFVGSVGDSVACVGNLSVVQRRAAWNTCAALLDVVQSVSSAAVSPPLRAVAHLGQLWGSFGHGCGGVRYDVYGPALETALCAAVDCPAGRGLASLTLMDGAGASAEVFDVVSTVGEENFVGVDWLQPTGDLRSEPLSTGSEGTVVVPFNALFEAFRGSGPSDAIPGWIESDPSTDQNPLVPPALAGDRHMNEAANANVADGEDELVPSELQAKLERYKEVRMVWCCFPRFVDDEVENAYVAERMAALPEAASRTWFAYSLYVLVILCLLLVDMHEPNGVIGVVLLALASLLSVAMGTVPKVLTREAMSRWYFVWSVVGMVLPLLVVYGCAVSRPSAVGNDASLYPVLGAFVRSYCFASSRWQAVIVPLMTAAGLFQYLLPGGFIRYGLFFMIIFIAIIVVSEREREGAHRENARRKVERKLLLAQSRVEEALRDGLLVSTLPSPVLSYVKAGPQSKGSRSYVLMAEGVTMVVRALSGSSSAKRFEALDAVLSQHRKVLSMTGLLGDQAVVVGPVPQGFSSRHRPQGAEVAGAVRAAVMIGTRLEYGSPVASSTGSHLTSPSDHSLRKESFGGSSSTDRRAFSVVMDVDDVVHTLEVGEFAQYWALGVSVTRLMAIVQGVDASALCGCLATDRLVKRAKQFDIVNDSHARALGPMKVRGAGMVRLSRFEGLIPSL